MSSVAIGSPGARGVRFYETTVFKKAIMAATGVVLFGFVIGHMIGNLQVYEGPDKLNAYGAFLHSMPGILWTVRIVLLACVTLHIVTTVQLALLKSAARPVGYVKKDNSHSSYASRTMYWSGPIIAAFVIYHIYMEGDVYNNVVRGFQSVPVSAFYIFAMALLCMHLYHGAWSMFQSLGINHPRYTPLLRRFAAVMAFVILIGNISIPVAVLAGVLK
jgi:succinate dehydrogenase / fumarate reductase cytochrome b subunit